MITQNLTFASMFLLGLLGSGHCLGMCGPLVVALPGRFGNWQAHLAYHAGRIFTYTVMGAFLGAVSAGFSASAPDFSDPSLAGVLRLQLAASGLAALFLFFFGFNRLGLLAEPAWLAAADMRKVPILGRIISLGMSRPHAPALFLMGIILGMLPCGLSWAALARALAAGGGLNGGLLVLGFGLGTLPGLLMLGTGAGLFLRRHRQSAEMLAGLIMIAMAIMLAKDVVTAIV